jgi:hypothetical protein
MILDLTRYKSLVLQLVVLLFLDIVVHDKLAEGIQSFVAFFHANVDLVPKIRDNDVVPLFVDASALS